MAKPTLQEIADMPYPASLIATRKNYDQLWGKFASDGEIVKFKVKIKYSVPSNYDRTYEVEATNEKDAASMAEELFDKDRSVEADADVSDVIVTEAEA